MKQDKIKIICVAGPTASGKTTLGVEIALRYGGEVISADSMQIYKGISVASAAPTDAEMCGVPHHLIGFLDLSSSFTVAEYLTLAREKIAEIAGRGKLPVIVGGTGLYLSSLVDNIRFEPQETDPTLRERLEQEFDEYGAEAMLCRLGKFDPEAAAALHPNNRRRIIRAIEVYELTGKTFTELNAASRAVESPYDALLLGIDFRDRAILYDRIERRVDGMVQNGIVDEARATIALSTGSGATQAIGHKELYGFLNGQKTLEECIEELKRSTRRYAKRQLTWFRKDPRIHWIYADETENIAEEAFKIIEGKENECDNMGL